MTTLSQAALPDLAQDVLRTCFGLAIESLSPFLLFQFFFCFKSRPAHSATQIAARVVALIVLQWRRTVHFINSYIIPSRSRPGQNNIVVHTHTPRSFALEDLYICKTRERAMFEHINHVKWRSGCYVLDLVISRKSNHLRNIQIFPFFLRLLVHLQLLKYDYFKHVNFLVRNIQFTLKFDYSVFLSGSSRAPLSCFSSWAKS